MRAAIEVFTIVILITVSCILFSSIIGVHVQTTQARSYYGVIVERIEDSNFNLAVIEDCILEASENGYEVEVIDLTIFEDEPSFFVTMRYEVEFNVFEMFGNAVNKEGLIEGYAR